MQHADCPTAWAARSGGRQACVPAVAATALRGDARGPAGISYSSSLFVYFLCILFSTTPVSYAYFLIFFKLQWWLIRVRMRVRALSDWQQEDDELEYIKKGKTTSWRGRRRAGVYKKGEDDELEEEQKMTREADTEPIEREGPDFREWLSRARLAKRLQQADATVEAYERCVAAVDSAVEEHGNCGTPLDEMPPELNDFHVAASLALLEIYVDDKDAIGLALGLCHSLIDISCTPDLPPTGERPRAPDKASLPQEVTAALYRLVATHGLKAVRAATKGRAHRAVGEVFAEVTAWRVSGYDC
ncbi:hypothetical protein T492DRAFT_837045 [Pavlovales sp. CCMP2436]|nr:hypothetical protein T492DRAFT_837045 [Pavlovales sp. CCMP2436]